MAVSKDKNGTWSVQLWYRDYQDVRRHKVKRGFESEAAARAWEKDFLAEAKGSMDTTFSAFFGVYEADMRPRVRESTWRTKRYIVEDKILPCFGRMKMNEIDTVDVLRWQNILMNHVDESGKPYSPTYLRTINNQLAAVFNHAVRFYGLPKSPCAKTVKMGSSKGAEMEFWTKEEYLRFADAAMDKPEAYHAFEILYWCGLRVGEMLALTPADLDFEKPALSVTKSYQRMEGRDVITDPKTPKSVRKIVMPGFLADEMADYLEALGIQGDARIFNFTKSFMHHEMDRCSAAAGVKRIRVHDLRHSHVSLLIDMGFSAIAIADRLGHETTDITFRYAHLFPNKQEEMARALDDGWRNA